MKPGDVVSIMPHDPIDDAEILHISDHHAMVRCLATDEVQTWPTRMLRLRRNAPTVRHRWWHAFRRPS